ncbi:alpha-amylase family glycosyl hydrolase [Sediminispirochaeta smaragdinae]|uniref:Alpha amylase catalytic region n=1 Tax=Sediminispirochaeta smaragdinae (strain DSM 11293 / JCM 15392 / SEBR 4228) TaxID=573413 RepID=E1RAD1_SEDSS|nr:alpha-amylase family glycosyl hydrolase [Sediminispirochaeta smaragdinae]ADK79422.1 alpha amylase catalytic region [Sediminispirochaeta smaragdinae DSM 11293]
MSVEKYRKGMPISVKAREQFRIADLFPEQKEGRREKEPGTTYAEAQEIAQLLNRKNKADRYPEHRVSTASVFALGLIRTFQYIIIKLYSEKNGGEVSLQLLKHLAQSPGRKETESTLSSFETEFFKPSHSARTEEEQIEELLLLWLTNQNRAARFMRGLFSDRDLERHTSYQEVIASCYLFFSKLQGFGPGNLHLMDMLRSPAINYPDNLLAQLEYIRDHWGPLLGSFLELLLRGIDYLKEEQRPFFPPGPGPSRIPIFRKGSEEYERFSSDSHWMPEVVLIAKSTLVWLNQLSRFYHREIHRLDQIPDQELDVLAERGFTALWLIGLWERSDASRKIKQWSGNQEAAASAYSLKRYEIAEELGGWEALDNLRERCRQRGIRLASDMVPNHTGLDSDWLFEHPEWFIQCSAPPFPGYTYSGESVVDHPDIEVHLEDHYWDRSDAAVTFQYVDRRSGSCRYIYHGNDGTSMPWNDTAQLDYLNPHVREVVIQTILHVARNFPIIRFDAAMTLAKKHIQRLWYPQPGHGGDIPSRSRFGIDETEFHERIPEEFWREVVDRVAAEVPDTLLLAEAFWMMEGYFVRTLGMHRVYNSAFMNMLKNEENAKYRQTIKNTLEYDPEILKRFVNFMNNPDEDTAYAQFGDGDKYFGVCTMMTAMPGLPMFGHGQIEGFREKYGMEFRKAYLSEEPDRMLIERHEREIFPLTRIRSLFAEVEHFNFYDFHETEGRVNENVFVWSNKKGEERAIVAYNNCYQSSTGSFSESVPVNRRRENGRRELVTGFLAANLDFTSDDNWFLIFQEQRSGLWFIRENKNLFGEGFGLILAGYQSQLFLNFREVYDSLGIYRYLCEKLGGSGTKDIERMEKELRAAPVREPFRRLLSKERIAQVEDSFRSGDSSLLTLLDDTIEDYRAFLAGCRQVGYGDAITAAEEEYRDQMIRLDLLLACKTEEEPSLPSGAEGYLLRGLSIAPEAAVVLYAKALLTPLWRLLDSKAEKAGTFALCDAAEAIEELLLPELFDEALLAVGVAEPFLPELRLLISLLPRLENWTRLTLQGSPAERLKQILSIPEVARYCGINEYEGIRWYGGESLQQLFWYLAVLAMPDDRALGYEIVRRWHVAEEEADYRLDQLFELLENQAS